MMKNKLFALLLMLAESVYSQPSFWFQQFQRQGNAQLAQQYEFTNGTGITFSFDGVHSVISASGGGGPVNLQLFGDVTSPLTLLPNVTTTLKNTGAAGTYTKTTFDAQGRETSGTAAVLASADFVNQGTTTTVLHGNGAGNPSFSQVNLATDVTGLLPTASWQGSTNVWLLTGNTVSSTNTILGTLDNNPLKLFENGQVEMEFRTDKSISIGQSNTTGLFGIAIGTNCIASGTNSVAIGTYLGVGASATSLGSIAIGGSTSSSGEAALALGSACNASAKYAVGIGVSSTAGAFSSVAMGNGAGTVSGGDYSFAMGKGAQSTFAGSFVWYDSQTTGLGKTPTADTATNQFVINARGGATFYTGRKGIIISEKDSSTAATIMSLTNGVIYANRGFFSASKNLLAPATITVGASPFSWTNSISTAGTNVFVFVDGSGVTGSVAINGTTIFSALTGADATIPLQPGEYVTVTYSIGTPAMTWKPF